MQLKKLEMNGRIDQSVDSDSSRINRNRFHYNRSKTPVAAHSIQSLNGRVVGGAR